MKLCGAWLWMNGFMYVMNKVEVEHLFVWLNVSRFMFKESNASPRQQGYVLRPWYEEENEVLTCN